MAGLKVVRLAATAAFLASLFLVGCGDEGGGDLDAGPDLCRRDDQCDDGVFCNGVEQCEPEDENADGRGCVFLDPPCLSAQRCDEEVGRCITDCDINGDADGDGVPAPECGGDDCDDTNANRYPGNVEICDPEDVDEDCDASTVGDRDVDGDNEIAALCCNRNAMDRLICGFDCNDARRGVNSTTSEVCDGFDNDCDGTVDEGVQVEVYRDDDLDGYGAMGAPVELKCPDSRGYSLVDGDCDDTDPANRPNWVELCDGKDNNCNGLVDEQTTDVVWYPDADGDGFGVANSGSAGPPVLSCAPVDSFALLPGDCDDSDPRINPGVNERCNGRDDDCNGRADFEIDVGDSEDDDGDGAPDSRCPDLLPGEADCDDADQFVRPMVAELCDSRDNDCDGTVDEEISRPRWYRDRDGDGFGDDEDVVEDCAPVSNRVLVGGDCNDSNANVRPGVIDGCEGIERVDDDCDSQIDETPNQIAYFRDDDGDGVGAGDPVLLCRPEAGRVSFAGDCAPSDPDQYPGNTEICTDGDDQDCDTLVDCDDPDCDGDAACGRTHVLVLIDGAGQTTEPNRFYGMPVVFRVEDLTGAAAPGRDVSLASVGFGAVSRSETSDASGIVRFQLQAPAAPGTQMARFSSMGARTVTVDLNVTAPTNGSLTTLINPDFGTSNRVQPSPIAAGDADGVGVTSVVAASNGNIYYTRQSRNAVYVLRPDGVVRLLAGTGTYNFSGDYGPAEQATLRGPRDLALSPDESKLYVVDSANNRVRVVDLVSGEIRTFAGGGSIGSPTYGDGGPATVAQLSSPSDVVVAADGTVYVSETGASQGIRRIRPDGTIERVLSYLDGTSALAARGCSGRCPLAIDDDGLLLMGGWFNGSRTNGSTYAIVRIEADGSLTHLAGYRAGSTSEGAQSVRTEIQGVRGLARASDGSFFFSEYNGHKLRRIDPITGEVRTVVGTGSPGFAGEGMPGPLAQLNRPEDISFDASGQLLIADSSNNAIRTVWGPVSTMATMVTVSTGPGAGTTTDVGGLVLPSLGVRVEAMGGGAIDGREVLFETVTAGSYVQSRSVFTVGGIAATAARSSFTIGMNTFRARVFDLAGGELPGSPLDLTVTVRAPVAGNMSTVVNVDHSTGDPDAYSHAVTLRGSTPVAVASDADGNLYVAFRSNYQIIKVFPDGRAEVFAGTGSYGASGDLGDRRAAVLGTPTTLCFDGSRNRLYVGIDGSPQGPTIRFIDLGDDRIYPFAGGGTVGSPSYGDGGPALAGTLSNPASCAVDSTGLVYYADNGLTRIRVIDPATGIINKVIGYRENDTSGVYGFWSCPGCSIAVDSMDRLIMYMGIRGPNAEMGTTGTVPAFVRRDAAGNFTRLAGRAGGASADGTMGLMATLPSLNAIALSSSGNILFSDRFGYRVRRLNLTSGVLEPVAGSGTEGAAGEHVPALTAELDDPRGMALWNGHLAITDAGTHSVRVVW